MIFSKQENYPTTDSVVNLAHPPILFGAKIQKANGPLTAGTILGFNPQTEEYEPLADHDKVAVLTKDVDTDSDDLAQVLVHGIIAQPASQAYTPEQKILLSQNNIYIA